MLLIYQQRNQMHSFPAVTEVTVEQSRQTIKQAITVRVVSAGTGGGQGVGGEQGVRRAPVGAPSLI